MRYPLWRNILRNSRSYFTRGRGGYFLCVRFRMAMISIATVSNTIISSYVLIRQHPFCKTQRG